MGRASRKHQAARLATEAEAAPAEGLARETRERPGWITAGLVVVLAAAALFRVAYFFQYRAESVFFREPILDALIYDEWAQRIAAGELRPAEPFYFAPGYPYALALAYRFASREPAAVYFLQFGLGLLSIFLIHRLAWTSFGRRAALMASALAALYASFPFLEAKIMSASLSLATLLAALVALAEAARGRSWLWAGAGLLLGVTSLVRPETLLSAPFILAWMAFGTASLRGKAAGWGRWKPLISAGVLLLAGWAAAIAPAAAHNASRGGGLTLISSQGGITFYQSNNPRARGLYVSLTGEGFSGAPATQAEEEKQIAEKESGRPMTRSEVSAWWFGRGLSFIADQPGRFVWLLGMKALRFVGSYEYSTEYILYVERERVWLLRAAFVPFALLVALATPTLFSVLRPARREGGRPAPPRMESTGWLMLAMLAANLAVCLAFYVSSRYRLPSAPPLMIFAGATLAAGAEALRRGRRADLVARAAVVTLIFAVAHFDKDASAAYQEANVHFNTANIQSRKGEYTMALEEYQRAVELDDSRYNLWLNLGNTLRVLERPAEAAEAYAMSAKRRRKFATAHLRECQMREKIGQWELARAACLRAEELKPGSFDVQLALGRVALATGNREEAASRFDRALSIRPGDEAAMREREKLR